jgi:hypothetical protein
MDLVLLVGEISFREKGSSHFKVREMTSISAENNSPTTKELGELIVEELKRWLVAEIRGMQIDLLESHGHSTVV